MHILDGLISAEINISTAVASTGVVALALYRSKGKLEEREVPLLGMTAAFIFAAQMLKFPVAIGTSGHLLGAVLAAVLVGPLNGVLVMTLVLGIQCLIFGDGGLTALGTNVFNIAIVSVFAGYGLFAVLRRILPDHRVGFLSSVGLAAWFSVFLGATACALEMVASGKGSVTMVVSVMAGIHSLIGIGEALITITVLSMVLAIRPDLLDKSFQQKYEQERVSNSERLKGVLA
jgi:cobalt/nickel transport system permease protein